MAPSAPKFVAYYRVSTQRQGQSGLGLEAQAMAVSDFMTRCGGRLVAEFREVESGRKRDRPELLAAIRKARLTRATLVIAKLDRLARDYHFLRDLQEANVAFVCCDNPNATELTIHILASVAQDEAKRTSERTKAALAAAKARGVKLGGDRCGIASHAFTGAAASLAVRAKRADELARAVAAEIEIVRREGAYSLREIAVALNARDCVTSRGKQWSATQVQRVMARA